jgi:riboflavin kinase
MKRVRGIFLFFLILVSFFTISAVDFHPNEAYSRFKKGISVGGALYPTYQPKGVEELKKEYNEYRRIFELSDHVTVHGCVTSGMGEGSYYICQSGYMKQFESLLGFAPFEGTLNIALDQEDVSKLDVVRGTSGILVEGFVQDGRSFGNVIAYKAKISNIDCAIVVPERSHYIDTIEIICQFHLRRTLSLEDGDRVDVRISF